MRDQLASFIDERRTDDRAGVLDGMAWWGEDIVFRVEALIAYSKEGRNYVRSFLRAEGVTLAQNMHVEGRQVRVCKIGREAADMLIRALRCSDRERACYDAYARAARLTLATGEAHDVRDLDGRWVVEKSG